MKLMDTIKEKELDIIKGGNITTVSGTIISALSNIIKMIREAGYDIGSGIRRIIQNDYCPLK